MAAATVNESVFTFGPRNSFVGVLAHPEQAAAREPYAVIFLNAGIIHRCGPFRLYVRLARALAANGVPTLRIDLPGVGDSGSVPGASVREDNVNAVRQACDALEKDGVARRFILLGICAGADNGFITATVEPRVSGAVLIDPTAVFPTPLHYLIRGLRAAIRPGFWMRVLRDGGGVRRQLAEYYQAQRRLSDGPGRRLPATSHETPAPGELKEQARQALATMASRGTRLLIVITGHHATDYTYRRQFFHAFRDLRLHRTTEVIRYPGAAHTFGNEHDRRRLETDLLRWVRALPVPTRHDTVPSMVANGRDSSRMETLRTVP